VDCKKPVKEEEEEYARINVKENGRVWEFPSDCCDKMLGSIKGREILTM
jgi:hypothetical protein